MVSDPAFLYDNKLKAKTLPIDEDLFRQNVELKLNQERLVLNNQVVEWCSSQIKRTTKPPHPFAPPDPNKYHKDRLCELQIKVLERSKVITQLQTQLTDMIITCPETAIALQGLKEEIKDIEIKRETNGYGYGKDVLKIASNTLDSVKSLVDQVPCKTEGVVDKERVYRSLSENAALMKRHRPVVSRGRTLSSNQVSSSTLSNFSSLHSYHSNSYYSNGLKNKSCHSDSQYTDIRALSNLEMNDVDL